MGAVLCGALTRVKHPWEAHRINDRSFVDLSYIQGVPINLGLNVVLRSRSESSTPATSTVCGTFQFVGVKVNDVGETVPSLGSSEIRLMVTSDVG